MDKNLIVVFYTKVTTPLNIFFFLLDVNFDKFTIRLHFFLISSILAKFQENQRVITMLSIKYLNFEFCSLKLYIKK